MDLPTRRLTFAVMASTLLLSACAARTSVTPLTSSPVGYSLYYIDAQSLANRINVVDTGSGRLVRTLPLGTPSPDWSRLFAVSYDSSRTILRAVDTKTAAVIHQVSLAGSFALPLATAIGPTGGLSPNGDWLVLEGQVVQNQTSFVLMNTSFTQHPRRISLTGSFSFDAISNDGQRLYLIESLAAAQPGHYRVRVYHLAAGSLDPRVIIDKREIETGSMTGTRISGIFSPDGAWQYSLYVNESKGAFIHALNLDSTVAWCIDLPAPQADQYLQTMWSLAIKPDGGALFAVNPDLASAARIDIGPDGPAADVSQVTSLKLVSAAPATPGFFTDALAKEIQMGSAALSRDGRTLFATTFDETVAINLATPTSQRRILDGAGVESVVMSQDGAWLFASSWDGPSVLRISPTTGTAVKILKTDTAWMLVRAEPR
jgi:hypothetical protein